MKSLFLASFTAAACFAGSSALALTTIDFSSGTWDIANAAGDFYRQENFTVDAPNGSVDPSSVGLQRWEWQNFCQSACGPTVFNPTTVTFMNGAEFYNLTSVTIITNLGGIRFNADAGLQAIFPANDVGLKQLNWNGISVLTVTNLLGASITERRDAAIDSIRVSAVPEPSSAVLLCLGLMGSLVYGWRERQ